VKLEGALIAQVEAILADGIPVMGHVGLLPQTAEKRRRYGITPEEYAGVLADAFALDQAGCFAIVIEAVVPDLAAEISAAVGAPTIGIAAGMGCDGQVLVTTDLIGGLPSRPAFVTPKANIFATIQGAAAAFASEARAEARKAA
jgi:3-methyl-2-oxobutanoate hydroxymethyltransferase